jgi:hypothetical protein
MNQNQAKELHFDLSPVSHLTSHRIIYRTSITANTRHLHHKSSTVALAGGTNMTNFPGSQQWECGRKWRYGGAVAIGFTANESRTGE